MEIALTSGASSHAARQGLSGALQALRLPASCAAGDLVTLEAGKITSEGLGEVQEMIDICDFAVGLSRQLYGLTIATERADHRMMETWHPIGVCGVITAFNFPVAVWSWNAALAFVCGDPVVWKPSEKTPLTALAVQAIFERAAQRLGGRPLAARAGLAAAARETARRAVCRATAPATQTRANRNRARPCRGSARFLPAHCNRTPRLGTYCKQTGRRIPGPALRFSRTAA